MSVLYYGLSYNGFVQMKQELGIGPKNPNYVNPFSQRENMMDKTEVHKHMNMYNYMYTYAENEPAGKSGYFLT